MSVLLRLPGGGSGGGGEGGGPNGNSIILADNTTISTYSYDNKITVKWNPPPNTEMPIDHYVLYWKKTSTAPTSIDQYDDYIELSAGTREYSVTGLTNNDQYFFFLESVGTNEFGNASQRTIKKASVGIPLWVVFYMVSRPSGTNTYSERGIVATSYDLDTFTIWDAPYISSTSYSYYVPTQQGPYAFTTNGWFFLRWYSNSYTPGYPSSASYNNVRIIKDYDFSVLSSNRYNYDFKIPSESNHGAPWTHCKDKMFIIVQNGGSTVGIYKVLDGTSSMVLHMNQSNAYAAHSMIYIPEKKRIDAYCTKGSDSSYYVTYYRFLSTDDGLTFNVSEVESTSGIYRKYFWWKDRYYDHESFHYSFDGNTWVSYSTGGSEQFCAVIDAGKYLYAFVCMLINSGATIRYGVRISSDGVNWSDFIALTNDLYTNTSFGAGGYAYVDQSSCKNGFGIVDFKWMSSYNAYSDDIRKFPLDGTINQSNTISIGNNLMYKFEYDGETEYWGNPYNITAITNTVI